MYHLQLQIRDFNSLCGIHVDTVSHELKWSLCLAWETLDQLAIRPREAFSQMYHDGELDTQEVWMWMGQVFGSSILGKAPISCTNQ